MCFSAEVSFGTGTLLGGVGYACFKSLKTNSMLFLAMIPMLFAFQQFSEGFIWLSLKHQFDLFGLQSVMPFIYVTFAFLVWPVWIPFSLYILEKNPVRKKGLLAIFCVGALLDVYYLSILPNVNLKINIVGHGLHYFSDNIETYHYIYITAVLLPMFISSTKRIWIFGISVAASYLASELFFQEAFLSVWCFFSAVCSGILYFLIFKKKKVGYE